MRHIRKNHSNAEKEQERAQVPSTENDFAKIPGLIAMPDKVVFGIKNRLARDQIAYLKTLSNGSTLYQEEVRTGRRELAVQTIRKYPAKR